MKSLRCMLGMHDWWVKRVEEYGYNPDGLTYLFDGVCTRCGKLHLGLLNYERKKLLREQKSLELWEEHMKNSN